MCTWAGVLHAYVYIGKQMSHAHGSLSAQRSCAVRSGLVQCAVVLCGAQQFCAVRSGLVQCAVVLCGARA